jgi:protein-disulfide isomerase
MLQEPAMVVTRRAVTALLLLAGLAALAHFSPLRLIADPTVPNTADAARPVSLPDMALGPANAKVTITEYASPTCPHCAAFNSEVFPKIKAAYIDTGKVRYVFREFPRNLKDAACAMLARRIANGDAIKYFAVLDLMFREQDQLVEKTTDTLQLIGRQAGLSAQGVEDCLKDQALLYKLNADRKFAADKLKVEGTPTFFINGETIVGAAPFEEFDNKIKSLLKS